MKDIESFTMNNLRSFVVIISCILAISQFQMNVFADETERSSAAVKNNSLGYCFSQNFDGNVVSISGSIIYQNNISVNNAASENDNSNYRTVPREYTGWTRKGDDRYYYRNGTKLKGTQIINGIAYSFDNNGKLTGKYTGEYSRGKRIIYYYNGKRVTKEGRCVIGNKAIEFGKDGEIKSYYTGWIKRKGEQYHFTNGSPDSGITPIDLIVYEFADDGKLIGKVSGWAELNGGKIWCKDGIALTGCAKIDGRCVIFDRNGFYQGYYTGWRNVSDGWSYYVNGLPLKGHHNIKGIEYSFDDDGICEGSYTGWYRVNEEYYYFKCGKKVNGFAEIDDNGYEFSKDGVYIGKWNGWKKFGEVYKYYNNGKYCVRAAIIDGICYAFDDNGVYTGLYGGTFNSKNGRRYFFKGKDVKEPLYLRAFNYMASHADRYTLEEAFRISYSIPYYGHNGIMPETHETPSEWYADFGFAYEKGNCFVMAAMFCQMARNLGYDAHQVYGTVPLRSGGEGPHSWVEIHQGGKTYVYDPDFQYNTKLNGFKIEYGQKGTWRYNRKGEMN